MTADSGFLYQHPKKPYTTPLGVSDTAQQHQGLFVALARLVAFGFKVDTDGLRLKVSPATLLTPAQRDWIQTHKAVLVAAVSAPRWRWCVEYPDGRRTVVDCLPEADWRNVTLDYAGAAVWPAPDGLDVANWIDAGRVAV